MPYSVSWEPEGIYRSFSGFIDGAEILDSNMKLYRDARFKGARYIINNFSEVSGHSIDAAQLEAFVSTDEMISMEKHAFKLALVVPQDEYIGLANYLCELTKHKLFEYEHFQTIEDARKWVAN